jgi:hypothetical protein
MAGTDGLCAIHAGRTDPRELGRKGGRARTRSLLGISDTIADDSLRASRASNSTGCSSRRWSYGSTKPPAKEDVEAASERP